MFLRERPNQSVHLVPREARARSRVVFLVVFARDLAVASAVALVGRRRPRRGAFGGVGDERTLRGDSSRDGASKFEILPRRGAIVRVGDGVSRVRFEAIHLREGRPRIRPRVEKRLDEPQHPLAVDSTLAQHVQEFDERGTLGPLREDGARARIRAGGEDFDGETALGDLLTAANGFAFAAHLVLMRRVGRDLDPWSTAAVLFLQGLLMIALWSAPGFELEHAAATFAPPTAWFALYTILGATVLTYVLNTWALRHTDSSKVALYINLQPIIAAALSCALGAPAPDHRFFVALVLVAFALWLQARARGAG